MAKSQVPQLRLLNFKLEFLPMSCCGLVDPFMYRAVHTLAWPKSCKLKLAVLPLPRRGCSMAPWLSTHTGCGPGFSKLAGLGRGGLPWSAFPLPVGRSVGVEVAVRDGFQMRGLPSPLLWPGQASPRGQRGSLSGSSTASMCARHTGSELPVTSQVSCWAFKCFFFTRRFGGWGTTVYFVGGVWPLERR